MQNLSCQVMVTEKAGPFRLFCKWGSEAVVRGGLCVPQYFSKVLKV